MTVVLFRRLLQGVLAILVVSVIVFLGVYAIADPIALLVSPDADVAEIERARRVYGLDKPLWTQYFTFVKNALQGDLGRSFVFNRPALELIVHRFPATLELALVAFVIAVGLGIPLGLWAGLRPKSIGSRAIMTISILGFSVPGFWVGLMLIMAFSVSLGWLPSTGRGELAPIPLLGIETSLMTADGWVHIILPAINLSTYKFALVLRLTYAGVREQMKAEYVRFARAKGLHPRRIVGLHVTKNISLPLVTVIGLEFGSMLALTVVTETVFAWPGMGKLMIDSINLLDRPVIVAYLMMTVIIFIVINLIVDLLYSALDPRVRVS